MKISQGTYGKDTQDYNALALNLLKKPEIAPTVLRLFPQFSLQYFVDGSNSFANEQVIGSNKHEWFMLGRLNRPVTMTGVFAGNGAASSAFTFETEQNYLNPNDTVKFKDGNIAIIMQEPAVSAGGYTWTAKLLDSLKTVAAASFTQGETAGKVATAFSENSERGYENHVYPDKFDNYLTTHRKSSSITGGAATAITWVERNGSKLWMHQDAYNQMQEFMYEREKDSWYGIRNVDANGVSPIIDPKTGKPIYTGDGILRQIDGANTDSYNGNLTEKKITKFIAHLRLNSGYQSADYKVYTGTGGFYLFDQAMKDFWVETSNAPIPGKSGDVSTGLGFKVYSTLGCRITLVHNPIFDDMNINTDMDIVDGFPKESYRMVFLNMGAHQGVNNIERKVRGADNINRSMVVKHIAGMTNIDDPSSLYAQNSRDNFDIQFLSESCISVRNPLSCGEFRRL